MNKHLTVYFPYYNQPELLKFNLDTYSKFNEEILGRTNFIIVDDCSEDKPAYDIVKEYAQKLDISLYRIDVNIPWNMPEANNIAFKEMKTPWAFRTDIDHFLDEENLYRILKGIILEYPKTDLIYQFKYRCNYKGGNSATRINQLHENSYIIFRDSYWVVGGYNEVYSGNYGWDDIDFLMRAGDDTYKSIIPDIEIGRKFFQKHNLDMRYKVEHHIRHKNISIKEVEEFQNESQGLIKKAYKDYEDKKEVCAYKFNTLNGVKRTELKIFANNSIKSKSYGIDKNIYVKNKDDGDISASAYHNIDVFIDMFKSLDKFKHTYTKLI